MKFSFFDFASLKNDWPKTSRNALGYDPLFWIAREDLRTDNRGRVETGLTFLERLQTPREEWYSVEAVAFRGYNEMLFHTMAKIDCIFEPFKNFETLESLFIFLAEVNADNCDEYYQVSDGLFNTPKGLYVLQPYLYGCLLVMQSMHRKHAGGDAQAWSYLCTGIEYVSRASLGIPLAVQLEKEMAAFQEKSKRAKANYEHLTELQEALASFLSAPPEGGWTKKKFAIASFIDSHHEFIKKQAAKGWITVENCKIVFENWTRNIEAVRFAWDSNCAPGKQSKKRSSFR